MAKIWRIPAQIKKNTRKSLQLLGITPTKIHFLTPMSWTLCCCGFWPSEIKDKLLLMVIKELQKLKLFKILGSKLLKFNLFIPWNEGTTSWTNRIKIQMSPPWYKPNRINLLNEINPKFSDPNPWKVHWCGFSKLEVPG